MGEMDAYLETFHQEARELLASMEEAALSLEANPDDVEAVNQLFRAAHTVKGSGGMFGLTALVAFTHQVETMLDKVRTGLVPVTQDLIGLILSCRDHMGALLGCAGDGTEADTDRSSALGEAMMAVAADAGAGPGAEPPGGNPAGTHVYRIRFSPDEGVFETGMDPALLLDELKDMGPCEVVIQTDRLPAFTEMNPEKCYLGWDVFLTSPCSVNQVKDVFIFVEDQGSVVVEEIAGAVAGGEPSYERPRLGEILVERGDIDPAAMRSVLEEQRRMNTQVGDLLVSKGQVSEEKVRSALVEQKLLDNQRGAAAANDTLKVPAAKLDRLVNLVGELVIGQEQLSVLASASQEASAVVAVETLTRLVSELRDLVLGIRMMPIGQTFSRFKRLVRDTSLELGKEIDLLTEGSETELDKAVMDRLADPLVHLMRNCIDHGIESPEERVAASKARRGTIRLSAANRGAHVVITIEDDGRGLDVAAIRAKAIDRGLVGAEASLSEQDIYALVFAPGFSTAKRISNLSGRGVGMDVVKRAIESLRGSVSISSEQGKGTTITLVLPLTMAIIDGLLVEAGGESYVIPVSIVEECVEFHDRAQRGALGRDVIDVRGEPVPMLRLREVFQMPGELPAYGELVIVRVGDARLGIMLDSIVGDLQTVIKPLTGFRKTVEGVSGATILGDGSVALILDVAGLLRLARNARQVS